MKIIQSFSKKLKQNKAFWIPFIMAMLHFLFLIYVGIDGLAQQHCGSGWCSSRIGMIIVTSPVVDFLRFFDLNIDVKAWYFNFLRYLFLVFLQTLLLFFTLWGLSFGIKKIRK